MAKGSGCFNCKHHCNGRVDPPGWTYECSKGLKNDHIMNREDVLQCPGAAPLSGFYIAGYYSHAEVEKWGDTFLVKIWSDGEFPTHPETGKTIADTEPEMEISIGSLDELIDFAQFWKKVLKVTDDE